MYAIRKNEYDDDFYSDSRWIELKHCGRLFYLENIKNDLEAISKLVNTDFKDLTDEDFLKLTSYFYSFYITKDDILNLLSENSNVKFDKIQKLNTRMTFKDTVSEGHGRDFSYWDEIFQVFYIVATSKDLKLNPEYNYSIDEIKQMIEKNQIISFGGYREARGMNPDFPFVTEQVEKISFKNINLNITLDSYEDIIDELECSFDFNSLITIDSTFSNEIYNLAISMIRKKLNKKKVLTDCKEIVLFLNDNINVIDTSIKNEHFENESDRQKYLKLSKEITDNHNKLLLKLNQDL